MSDLTDFLAERNISGATKTLKISKEIPFDFTIKVLTSKKHKNFQDQCTTYGKKGKGVMDSAKLQTLICLECTVEPNFASAEFIGKIGVATPEEALDKVLAAGEQSELYAQILAFSGFDQDINDDIEEAKN